MRFIRKFDLDDEGWTGWQAPIMQGYKMACCDCGLVHDINFQVVTAGRIKRDGSWIATPMRGKKWRVQMRVRRNARSTSAMRRNLKPTKP